MKHIAISILAFTLLLQTRARAQVGEDGDITTRSDVKMSVEGGIGTGGERLDALADHLGAPLAEMKRCYAKIVTRDPGMTGTLRVDLELGKKGGMRVTPVRAEHLSWKMRNCVHGAFQMLSSRNLTRPLKARIALELSNSAADSVPEVRANEQEAARVDVRTDADGRSFSEGRSLEGEVAFRVSANGANAESVITRVHTAVRDALPSLFDCRRKSGKLGSPEGELKLDVFLGGGAAKIEVRSSTVSSERASPCVDRAMTRGLTGLGWGRAKLELRFAP
jgi:hypothetical protein